MIKATFRCTWHACLHLSPKTLSRAWSDTSRLVQKEKNACGKIAVQLSCIHGDPLPVVENLNHQELLMQQDQSGNTPLHLKCMRPDFRLHVFQQLTAVNDAALEIPNKDGRLPLRELLLRSLSWRRERGGRTRGESERIY